MTKIINRKKAFTLIEVLVACAILIILITAVVELGVTLINNATLSRQRVTAYYLAQEGIETVRQVRDSNLAVGKGWKTLDWQGVNPTRDIATDGTTIYGFVPVVAEKRLYLTTSIDNVAESIIIDGVTYQRKITFVPAGITIPELDAAGVDANAVQAVVSVSWTYKNSPKNVEVRELITNWKQLL